MKTQIKGSILAAALLAVIGCGGGGAGGGAGVPAGNKVGFFVTSTSGPYSHVWVSVKQVSLVGPAGTVSLVKSTAGKSLDLSSLNTSGKKLFAALGAGSVPSGNYSQIQISLANSVTTIPQGATQGTTGTFSGASGSTKTITFATSANGTRPIVANFDLSKWSVSGTQVSASASEDSGSDVGSGTQEPQDFEGTVGNLAGTPPTLTFDIANDGTTTHVATDANTVISNSDGSPNPVLSNASKVDVVGTLDPTTLILAATNIKIRVGNSQQPNRVTGIVSTNSANTLVLTVHECEGLLPNSSTVNVAVTSATTYLDGHGITLTVDQFFAAAVAGTKVEASGTYDQPSNTLTATALTIRLDGQDGGGGGGGGGNSQETQVQGPAVSVDVANNAFTMTINEYEGALLTKGTTLNVVTTGTTQFNGITLATLTAGTKLEVKGSYSGTTLTATEVNATGG